MLVTGHTHKNLQVLGIEIQITQDQIDTFMAKIQLLPNLQALSFRDRVYSQSRDFDCSNIFQAIPHVKRVDYDSLTLPDYFYHAKAALEKTILLEWFHDLAIDQERIFKWIQLNKWLIVFEF